MVKSKSISDRILSVVCYTFTVLGMILCLLPILHTLALSLSDRASATAGLVGLLPVNFTTAAYEAIVKGQNVPKPGIPEAFKVVIKEFQSLCLDIQVLDENN